MDDYLKSEIKATAANLLSTVIKCQEENAHLLEIIRSMQYTNPSLLLFGSLYTGGDAADLYHYKKAGTPHFQTKLTQKEYISLLIKNATEENSRLRESNVKLKLESKSQDQKIKELNRKTLLHERTVRNQESQREVIRDLKKTINSKAGEIKILKQSLENAKTLLSKEQKKSHTLREHTKASSALQSKIIREVGSKLDTLLRLTNQLLKDQERAKSAISSNSSYVEKVQKVLSRLIIMNNNLVQQKSNDAKSIDISPIVQKGAYDNRQVKIDAGMQAFNRNIENCNTKGTYTNLSEAFTRSNFLTLKKSQNLNYFKLGHRRYKSV